MMELLLEIFLEFVLQFVGEVLLEGILHAAWRVGWVRRTVNSLLIAILLFGAGALFGWLSIWIFPNAFIRSSSLHGISLVITPMLAGLTMSVMGWIRRRQGKLVIRLESFFYGFIFAFGMALVRLLFTT